MIVYEVKERLTFWQKAFLWLVALPIVTVILTVGGALILAFLQDAGVI